MTFFSAQMISDLSAFIANTLVKYFRHSRYASFQRQLNLYGFRKNESGAFEHKFFVREAPELLPKVQRAPQPKPKERKEGRGAYKNQDDGLMPPDPDEPMLKNGQPKRRQFTGPYQPPGMPGGGYVMPPQMHDAKKPRFAPQYGMPPNGVMPPGVVQQDVVEGTGQVGCAEALWQMFDNRTNGIHGPGAPGPMTQPYPMNGTPNGYPQQGQQQQRPFGMFPDDPQQQQQQQQQGVPQPQFPPPPQQQQQQPQQHPGTTMPMQQQGPYNPEFNVVPYGGPKPKNSFPMPPNGSPPAAAAAAAAAQATKTEFPNQMWPQGDQQWTYNDQRQSFPPPPQTGVPTTTATAVPQQQQQPQQQQATQQTDAQRRQQQQQRAQQQAVALGRTSSMPNMPSQRYDNGGMFPPPQQQGVLMGRQFLPPEQHQEVDETTWSAAEQYAAAAAAAAAVGSPPVVPARRYPGAIQMQQPGSDDLEPTGLTPTGDAPVVFPTSPTSPAPTLFSLPSFSMDGFADEFGSRSLSGLSGIASRLPSTSRFPSMQQSVSAAMAATAQRPPTVPEATATTNASVPPQQQQRPQTAQQQPQQPSPPQGGETTTTVTTTTTTTVTGNHQQQQRGYPQQRPQQTDFAIPPRLPMGAPGQWQKATRARVNEAHVSFATSVQERQPPGSSSARSLNRLSSEDEASLLRRSISISSDDWVRGLDDTAEVVTTLANFGRDAAPQEAKEDVPADDVVNHGDDDVPGSPIDRPDFDGIFDGHADDFIQR